MGGRTGSVIWWIRRDLRLADNPALTAAAARGGPVVPVFIWSPHEDGDWPPGAASRWWLHQSLVQLHRQLRAKGSRLIVAEDDSVEALRRIITDTGATAAVWNQLYEPAARQRDEQVASSLRSDGVKVSAHPGNLLLGPGTVLTTDSRPYQVFTSFWKSCLARLHEHGVGEPLAAPRKIPAPKKWPKMLAIEDLRLEPRLDWAGGLRQTWTPGEKGASAVLDQFLADRLADYAAGRDRPGTTGTSRLSPHLHFGEISVRSVWHAVRERQRRSRSTAVTTAADKFIAEVGWREFAHHLLHHFPETTKEPLRPEFARFPWRDDEQSLIAWQRGRTGFPIVDAGMRELWHTGWMHNRVRMIVASFLVKDLLVPWQHGARWFWDTLVDADLANNTLGWQWTAGCGADAAPYFRVFNPMLQSKKFDPDGKYIRRWLPELAKLPDNYLFAPWEASEAALQAAGVTLGDIYPQPIVNHDDARKRALAAWKKLRSKRNG